MNDISLVNQETLEPIWTKTGFKSEHSSWYSTTWDRWYFEENKIIVYDSPKIFSIDVASGNTIWEIEQERQDNYVSQVDGGFLEIVDVDTYPYKKSFYNLTTGEIIPEKTEYYKNDFFTLRKEFGTDGYIIHNSEWYKPKTNELLGSIKSPDCDYFKIINIKDGYIYYYGGCPEVADKSDDYDEYYLICKKLY